MAWLNVDDGMGEHPKAWLAGNAALGLWLRLACYSARNLTDGFVPAQIASNNGTPAELKALIKSGLVDKVPNGFQLHDYLEWNKSKEKILEEREANRKRQQAWQDRKRANNRGDNGVSNTLGDTSLTMPTPLHSTPPSKEGSGSTPARKRGGARTSKETPDTTTTRETCDTHMQEIPCRGCAADRKAGDA